MSAANNDYDYDEKMLLRAYEELGLESGAIVFVGADLRLLNRFRVMDRATILNAHIDTLRKIVGPKGTLVFPTATLYLNGTDTPFDVAKTPSRDMGSLAEFARQHPEAHRSFHALWSHCAIGAAKHDLLDNISRHAHGCGSVFARLIEADAQWVSIGHHPRLNISAIHHLELLAGVPYRYTKEFLRPVIRDGEVRVEPFYLFVTYLDTGLVRDQNVKIFEHYERLHPLKSAQVGVGKIHTFPLRQFARVTIDYLAHDLYGWTREPPKIRPYQS